MQLRLECKRLLNERHNITPTLTTNTVTPITTKPSDSKERRVYGNNSGREKNISTGEGLEDET